MWLKSFRKDPKKLGLRGEQLAERYLRRQGYKILERNFRTKGGEVDLVARDQNQLVFVEVKTRSSANEEFLRVSVNRAKSRRLVKAAQHYIRKNKHQNITARFDVAFIVAADQVPTIELVKNAFRLDEIGL